MALGLSFEDADGYLAVRIEGEWTPEAMTQAIGDVAGEARARGYARVLADVRFVSAPKTAFHRFLAGENIAKAFRFLKLAIVYQAHLIDRFAETTALNRGAWVRVESDVDQALNWLKENPGMEPGSPTSD